MGEACVAMETGQAVSCRTQKYQTARFSVSACRQEGKTSVSHAEFFLNSLDRLIQDSVEEPYYQNIIIPPIVLKMHLK